MATQCLLMQAIFIIINNSICFFLFIEIPSCLYYILLKQEDQSACIWAVKADKVNGHTSRLRTA